MPLAALLVLACNASSALAVPAQLAIADEGGPPPGSPYPPPPPLVEDKPLPTAGRVAPPDTEPEAPPPSSTYPPPPRPQKPREFSLPPPPAPGALDSGTRFLWGLGARAGAGDAHTAVFIDGGGVGDPLLQQSSTPSFDVAIYVRLGIQINDRLGFEGEAHGGLVSSGPYGGGALTVDYSPADWFTVAVGPLVDPGRTPPPSDSENIAATSTTAVGGTLRLDFHLAVSRKSSGRSAFTLGVVGDYAAALGQFATAPTGGLYLTIGYAHY